MTFWEAEQNYLYDGGIQIQNDDEEEYRIWQEDMAVEKFEAGIRKVFNDMSSDEQQMLKYRWHEIEYLLEELKEEL